MPCPRSPAEWQSFRLVRRAAKPGSDGIPRCGFECDPAARAIVRPGRADAGRIPYAVEERKADRLATLPTPPTCRPASDDRRKAQQVPAPRNCAPAPGLLPIEDSDRGHAPAPPARLQVMISLHRPLPAMGVGPDAESS